jgi:hypothetical protein
MPTQKDEIAITDLNAVREFLLSGREIPRQASQRKPSQRSVCTVPLHNGIVRARSRSHSKD